MDKLLTYSEAAVKLKVSEQRVRQLVKTGRIAKESVGTNDRFVRIRESELVRYKTANTIPVSLPAVAA